MPAYNCERFIKQAIDSVLNQTYKNFELLILDDASKDQTRSIIDRYNDPRIRRFHHSINAGYLKSCNLLFDMANGEYITFQDADDFSSEDRFQKLINEFRKDNELMCLGSFVTRIDDNGVVLKKIKFETDYLSIKSNLPDQINCVGSTLMIKRAVLQKIGAYNNFFDRVGSEDLYWFGLITLNFKTQNIPEYLYFYRNNPHSVSQEINKNCKKIMSLEFAKHAIHYFKSKKKEIFDSNYEMHVLRNYLIGKCYCWKSNKFKGLLLIVLSVLMNPTSYPERYELFRIYFPNLIKSFFSRNI